MPIENYVRSTVWGWIPPMSILTLSLTCHCRAFCFPSIVSGWNMPLCVTIPISIGPKRRRKRARIHFLSSMLHAFQGVDNPCHDPLVPRSARLHPIVCSSCGSPIMQDCCSPLFASVSFAFLMYCQLFRLKGSQE